MSNRETSRETYISGLDPSRTLIHSDIKLIPPLFLEMGKNAKFGPNLDSDAKWSKISEI